VPIYQFYCLTSGGLSEQTRSICESAESAPCPVRDRECQLGQDGFSNLSPNAAASGHSGGGDIRRTEKALEGRDS